jgi:hypothetical protein
MPLPDYRKWPWHWCWLGWNAEQLRPGRRTNERVRQETITAAVQAAMDRRQAGGEQPSQGDELIRKALVTRPPRRRRVASVST